MWLRALLAGALCADLLGACAMVDPVDRRYDTIGRSLSKARDESIFLNLVRASHDYPLAFTTIANVTPTMTNASSFALPTFSIGPPNCLPTIAATRTITCTYGTGFGGAATALGSSTAANATSVSSNFNISTQETGSFYEGFLKPIDLQILDYFIRQDYPRELLFWLFADSFQLQLGSDPHRAIGYQYNPPISYGCPQETLPGIKPLCFRQWVWIALISGLTVEEKSIVTAGGGGRGQGDSEGTNQSGGGRGRGPETTIVARFCFSPFLQRQAKNQLGDKYQIIMAKYWPFRPNLIAQSSYCGNWTDADAKKQINEPQPDTFEIPVGPYKFRVVPRSAYGVFNFLGNLMKIEREHLLPDPSVHVLSAYDGLADEREIPPKLLTVYDDPMLLTVLQNDAADCFSHTWFYDGDYCVPQSATNTKHIFSLLSQLIAIETAAGDLSITPVVRVIE
jgi:hypothetical protein